MSTKPRSRHPAAGERSSKKAAKKLAVEPHRRSGKTTKKPPSNDEGVARSVPSSSKKASKEGSSTKEKSKAVAVTKTAGRDKAAARPPVEIKKSAHSRQEIDRIRHALTQKKDWLRRHLQNELSVLESVDKHHLADLEEMASDTNDTDSTVGIIEVNTDTLGQIEEALRKLDDGTYGHCEHCGGSIPIERLEALPFATLCIQCKKQQEFQKR